MHPNRAKEKIERGEIAYGVTLTWPSAELVQFFGVVGYDWVFIDAEHGPLSPETCVQLIRAAHLAEITPFVRVFENSPGTILRYLEAGAMGIIIPHLNTAEEARAAVAAVRYGPDGQRSAGSMTWVANFGLTQPAADYFAHADQEIYVWGIIEEERGVENLDAILAVEGLDVVGVGPGDLAMSMGLRGQPDHPEVRRTVERVERRVRASGKILMSLVGSPEQNRGAIERGARLIVTGATSLFAEACGRFLADLKSAAAPIPTRS